MDGLMVVCAACGATNRVPGDKIAEGRAPVCGKCKAGRVRVVKLNVDDNPRTAERFDLRSIPTLLVLKGGREIDRLVGVQPKQEIARRLERAIA